MLLQKNDIVEIVAPSGSCESETLKKSVDFVNSLGLIARTKKDLLGNDLHCSNDLNYRFEHLKEAFYADDSKAIWCLRGGYGSAQLFDKLDRLQKPDKQKIFIGFSDITFLHIFLNQKWGWKTVHGSVLSQFVNDKLSPQTIDKTKDILFNQKQTISFDNIINLNYIRQDQNRITAKICGGNLTLIENSIGTDWQINCKNQFLLLEEINEQAYKIDRMLLHLKQSNIFKDCKAILLGDFLPETENNKIQKTLKRFAENTDIPVFSIANIGHGFNNFPLLLNSDSVLNTGNNISLEIFNGLIDL